MSNTGEEQLNKFRESLIESNRGFDFYVNWKRATKLIEKYKIELNILNALIKNKNFDSDFIKIIKKLPTTINVLPSLFALSKSEREKLIKKNNTFKVANIEAIEEPQLEYRFNFSEEEEVSQEEAEKYLEFTKRIGLKYLFTDLLEKHLIDFVIGCEVGLDSNARKNRGGTAFESLLSPVINDVAKKNKITILEQKKFKELKKFGIKVTDDIANRKADFILVKDKKIVNIEVNFYGGAGSKPEEIIDSYINRQSELKDNGIDFILITDGKNCWGRTEKPQLIKGFKNLNYLMNFNMAKNKGLEEAITNIFQLN